jgi:hypothetical protein
MIFLYIYLALGLINALTIVRVAPWDDVMPKDIKEKVAFVLILTVFFVVCITLWPLMLLWRFQIALGRALKNLWRRLLPAMYSICIGPVLD